MIFERIAALFVTSTVTAIQVQHALPPDNAPLDHELAWVTSQLYGYNGESSALSHSFFSVSCGANMSVYHTDPTVFADAGSARVPILLLNHGYPESSYIWRDVTPHVSQRVPVIASDVSSCIQCVEQKLETYSLPVRSAQGTDSPHLAPTEQTSSQWRALSSR